MSALALEGTWRTVGGVMRWSPNPAPGELADLRARTRPARRLTVDVHQYVACPTCEARCDERCRSAGGHSTKNHDGRLTSVRCPCGDPVRPRKQYCEPCREKARKQTYRLREIRQSSSQRRAS